MVDFNSCVFNTNGRVNTIVGTQTFMAPEIFNGDDYDESCDIYSLGKTVLAFMTLGQVKNDELQKIANAMCREQPKQRPSMQKVLTFTKALMDVGTI